MNRMKEIHLILIMLVRQAICKQEKKEQRRDMRHTSSDECILAEHWEDESL